MRERALNESIENLLPFVSLSLCLSDWLNGVTLPTHSHSHLCRVVTCLLLHWFAWWRRDRNKVVKEDDWSWILFPKNFVNERGASPSFFSISSLLLWVPSPSILRFWRSDTHTRWCIKYTSRTFERHSGYNAEKYCNFDFSSRNRLSSVSCWKGKELEEKRIQSITNGDSSSLQLCVC